MEVDTVHVVKRIVTLLIDAFKPSSSQKVSIIVWWVWCFMGVALLNKFVGVALLGNIIVCGWV